MALLTVRSVPRQLWFNAASDGSYEEEWEEEEDEEEYFEPPAGERGDFILRVTLKDVVGRVDLVFNYKAVLTFDHEGRRHRALLLTGKYSFPEKATATERRDLTKVLSRGDHVRFTCHEYDKPNGTDRCGWWVMEAVKLETERSVGREAGYSQSGHLYEKIGTVKDVLAAEGLLHFVLAGRREVAWFSDTEVFINGRPCEGRLSDAIETGQRVHFNAVPGAAQRGADWRCTCVWRGEMPTVEASQRRTEAATVKKQKKAKSSKSRIDDLDDFELPSAPPSAGGDGWAVPPALARVPPQPPQPHTARPHLGGGDRGGRTARQPARLRASMADELDDFAEAGVNGSASGQGGAGSASGLGGAGSASGLGGAEGLSGAGGLGEDGGVHWTLAADVGGSWDEEVEPPSAGDDPAPAEAVSSGPSRPLSDASPEAAGPHTESAADGAPEPGRPRLAGGPEPAAAGAAPGAQRAAAGPEPAAAITAPRAQRAGPALGQPHAHRPHLRGGRKGALAARSVGGAPHRQAGQPAGPAADLPAGGGQLQPAADRTAGRRPAAGAAGGCLLRVPGRTAGLLAAGHAAPPGAAAAVRARTGAPARHAAGHSGPREPGADGARRPAAEPRAAASAERRAEADSAGR